MSLLAEDLARTIQRDPYLKSELEQLHRERFGLIGRTTDVRAMVEMLGLDETVRRLESRHASLEFDGVFLRWVENGMKARSWIAVSGARGYQDKQFQHERNKGPIPQGIYFARQSQLQRWEDYSRATRSVCALRAIGITRLSGAWPGCRTAWGTRRVWLEPLGGTSTFGRDNFSIHGGSIPGSAGCIDLTSNMVDFVDTFIKYGKDMHLRVCY